jgi:predicted N-formylglutamate amidohydrolase
MSFKDDLNSVFLLENDEPAAVTVERPVGRSPFFLTCDHAGNRIPRRLGDLGVAANELMRHIAWDVGAAGVAATLSQQLDALLIRQT